MQLLLTFDTFNRVKCCEIIILISQLKYDIYSRSWHSFNSILDIYRTGLLHLNNDMCALVLQVNTGL